MALKDSKLNIKIFALLTVLFLSSAPSLVLFKVKSQDFFIPTKTLYVRPRNNN